MTAHARYVLDRRRDCWPLTPALLFPPSLGEVALCVGGRAGLDPSAWDSDAPAELRELAARTCFQCPVLAACAAWADSMSRHNLSGTVAGRSYTWHQ